MNAPISIASVAIFALYVALVCFAGCVLSHVLAAFGVVAAWTACAALIWLVLFMWRMCK
jgi:hypothetical protein